MKKNRITKILAGTVLSMFGVLSLCPYYVSAEDLADDEIRIVEFRDCTDQDAGWTSTELSSVITGSEGSQNCYLNRNANYSMTSLYKEGETNTYTGHAFRLNATLTSPALNRLNISTGTITTDNNVKCKVNSSLLSTNELRAGIGAVINEIMNDKKVSAEEYYYGSLAMSKFIYDETGTSSYKVTGVTNSLYKQYLALAEEEADKATTSAEAKIDGKTITKFNMEYSPDGEGNDYIWKSADFITFEDMKYFQGLIKNNFSESIFQYTLTNTTTNKDYSDFVYAAIQNEDEDTGNDLVYQFGICDSKNYQVNAYDNCRELKGQQLPAGDYILKVKVYDKISYNKVKTIYSCSSSANSETDYTPVALSGNNVSATNRTINYTLTSSFTVNKLTNEDSKDTGSVHVSTIDKESKERVEGAVFKLCKTATCTSSNTLKTSTDGQISISPVSVGEYYLVVTSVPTGYIKPSARKITVTKGNTYEEDIILSKEVNSGSVDVKAVDSNSKVLTTAKVKVCKTSDCKDGALYSNSGNLERSGIPFGTYYLVVDVPEGYVTPSALRFTLDSDEPNYNRTIKISAKTTVPDTLSNASKIFIACGIIGIIAGIYLVYTNVQKQKQV